MPLSEQGLQKIAEFQRRLHGNFTGESKKYIRKTNTDFNNVENKGINDIKVVKNA